jgi:hypothetical protein
MNELTLVLLSLVTLSLLLWIFDFPYRQFRIGHARYHLRAVRNELQRATEAHVLSPGDTAYVVTYRMLTGMIECATEFNLWRALLMGATEGFWSNPDRNVDFFRRYEHSLRSLSPEGLAAVKSAMRSAHTIVASHVLHTSLITFPLIMSFKVLLRVIWTMDRIVRITHCSLPEGLFRTVDRGAYLAGKG